MLLLCALDAKGGVLVRHDIVFIIWIQRLVLSRHVNVFGRELDARKVFEQVCVVGGMQVQLGEV